MNPLRTITAPIRDLTQAIVLPFKAVFVVGLCGLINYMTYAGTWWVKWVALGMGIAVVVAFARAARSLLVLALVAWVGHKLATRYGPQARAAFDQWVARTQPKAAEVMDMWRQGATPSGSNGALLRH